LGVHHGTLFQGLIHTSSKDAGLGLGLLYIPAGLVLIVGIVAALFLFVIPS